MVVRVHAECGSLSVRFRKSNDVQLAEVRWRSVNRLAAMIKSERVQFRRSGIRTSMANEFSRSRSVSSQSVSDGKNSVCTVNNDDLRSQRMMSAVQRIEQRR